MVSSFLKAAAIAAIALGALTAPLSAQPTVSYPNKPVELVIPFPAGGATDVIARLVSQVVSQRWGQAIVIQNKAGATGAIASEYVARANPDGYTLLVATASTHAVLPAYRKKLPYDTVTSFAPATLLSTFPNVLVINPKKTPVKSVADLIDLLKKNPGKFNFASSGNGGSVHFAGELFKLMTKTEVTHVPYRGSAPALTDLISGTVEFTIDNMTTVWPQVKEGTLVALGVASRERTPLAPEIPAIAETIPGFEATSWVGIVAPAGTPSEILQTISDAYRSALDRPDIVKRLHELGSLPAASSPSEFLNFIREDRSRWQTVAREAHLSE